MYKTLIQLLLLQIIAALILSCAKTEAREINNINSDGGEKAVIVGSNVNVRERPSVDAKVVVQLQSGNMVTIIEKDPDQATIAGKTNHWYKVSGDFGSGWVFGAFITIVRENMSEYQGENLVMDPKVICEDLGKYTTCSEKIEAEWAKRYPDLIKRSMLTLSVKADNGKWVNFVTDSDIGSTEVSEESVYYELESYFRYPGAYHIHKQYYEGGASLLIVKATGEQIKVIGKPIFSKSKLRFACTSIDLEAGYDPTGIEIWEWNNGKCLRLLDFRDMVNDLNEPWGPTNVEWMSEDRIRFTTRKLSQRDGQLMEVEGAPIDFEFLGGKWEQVR